MFGRVVGGLRPPPPPNEPASGPSAPPWPWQGRPSFFSLFSPVALASAIIRTAYTGLALPTTSLGHSFELKAYFGSADNPGLMQTLRFRILPMQEHNQQGDNLVGQD